MPIPRDTLRETDRLLLRCGARASALLHPNPEPGFAPRPSQTAASEAAMVSDLTTLRDHLISILPHGHDVHPGS
jgi:hypothetical protein